MNQPSTPAQFSQFETNVTRQRVVLLGASNLSIKFPMVVQAARAMFDAPLELVVAKGFGRSYGRESKFFGKKFPGILQSHLWDAIDRAPRLPTTALIADVGNDLAYEAPAEVIVEWVKTALDRLAAHEARVVLNNVPLESLRRVGAARYLLFRKLFFPSCRLSRKEMLRRAEQLGTALEELARTRNIPIFSGEIDWYGLDPIHPRRRASSEIWRRMLAALAPVGGSESPRRVASIGALRLRRLKPCEWRELGFQRRAAQPCGHCADGATIALY